MVIMFHYSPTIYSIIHDLYLKKNNTNICVLYVSIFIKLFYIKKKNCIYLPNFSKALSMH